MDDGGKCYLGVQYVNTSPAEVRAQAGPMMMHSGFTGFTGSAYHPTFSGKVWFGNFSLIVFSGLSCIIAFFLRHA